MRLFLKKKWIGFQQQGMAYLAEDRYGGVRIRGVGWHGLAAGANTQMGKNIERDLEWVYASSMDVLLSDFDLGSGPKWKLLFVHTPEGIPVDEVVGVMLDRRDAPAGEARGRYLPDYCAAVVTGMPESVELYESSVHEACHALCHALLGAVGRIPWSYEGYADLVCDRLIQKRRGISTYQKHLVAFGELRRTGGDIPLREMLMIEDYGERMPAGYSSSFLSHAALFVHFLKSRAEADSEFWSVLRAAIREEASSCAEIAEKLEGAFGQTLERADEDFLKYCNYERRHHGLEEGP